jgi:serine/threonine protein kinase
MELGSRIGPYEIRELIGEGGMASVYKVWHTGLHRFEALKVPRQHGSHPSESDFVHRLLNEARIAAQLHHPHIVGIHNVSEAEAAVQFFAMEYVAGYDLAQILEQRQRLVFQEGLPILRQVAEALDHAHMHGVVHRDIKPANILLQEVSNPGGWMAKVVDFGISRAAEDMGGTKLTKSGMIVGTPEYMSPEQAGNGDVVDYRTDIYSLGIVSYEMLCGHPPFTAGEGVSRMSILMSHVRDMPQPPAEHIPNLPMAANNAILKALAKHPEDRFDSCADFMRALSGSVTVTPPAMFRSTPPPMPAVNIRTPTPYPMTAPDILASTQAAPKSSALWPAVAGGIAVLACGALGWAVFRSGSPEGSAIIAPVRTPVGTPAPASTATPAPSPAPTVVPTVMPTPRPTAAPQFPVQTRVEQVRRTREVPFTRHTMRNATLPLGQRRVVRKGEPGTREVTLEIRYRGAQELSRKVLATRVLKAPVAQQEVVGTQVVTVPQRVPTATPRRPSRRVAPRLEKPVQRRAARRVRRPARRPSSVAPIREAPLPR